MKKIILSIAITMLFINSYAQRETTNVLKDDTLRFPKDKNKGKDIIIFDVYSDIWEKTPNNISVRTIDQGIDFYLMINRPISTSNFSIAYGLGISSHNFYSDGVPVLERDANGTPTGKTIFETLGSHYQTTVNYKTNKLNYIRGLTDKTTSIVSLYPDFLYEFITQCFQRANSIREIIKK